MEIVQVGEVSVWWIDRPRGPRLSAAGAALACGIVLPLLAAMLLWVSARGERLWVWSTVIPLAPSLPQVVLRYLYLAVAGILYLLAASLPAWIRVTRTARSDLAEARRRAAAGDWPQAALHLHRHSVLHGEWRRRSTPREGGSRGIAELDSAISPHLHIGRRLCVYHRGSAPPLPDSPQSGFQPRIVPIAVAGGWWTGGVVAVVAVAVLGRLVAALSSGEWRGLMSLNFIIEGLVVVAYVVWASGGLLGRRGYFRFSPGVAELMQFKFRASSTETRSITLRCCDLYLDVSGAGAILSIVDRAGNRRIAEYEFGGDRETVETLFRAALSSAPAHALPRDELTG